LIEGRLKVFNLGADWFYQEMKSQGIDIRRIEWTPPIDIPDDIQDILGKLGE
jgi:hypothetical protein